MESPVPSKTSVTPNDADCRCSIAFTGITDVLVRSGYISCTKPCSSLNDVFTGYLLHLAIHDRTVAFDSAQSLPGTYFHDCPELDAEVCAGTRSQGDQCSPRRLRNRGDCRAIGLEIAAGQYGGFAEQCPLQLGHAYSAKDTNTTQYSAADHLPAKLSPAYVLSTDVLTLFPAISGGNLS